MKFCILVVEDQVESADSMVELLEIWGYPARAVYDGLAALPAVRDDRPGVVLLDIGLPGMNGYEVARQLRAQYGAGLRLIALTGYGQESDRRQALDAGFDYHMVKPVNLALLHELLETARECFS